MITKAILNPTNNNTQRKLLTEKAMENKGAEAISY